MDVAKDITTADVASDDVGHDLWKLALPQLTSALSGDEAAFLGALEAAARDAGLTGTVAVAALLDAYSEGSARLRGKIFTVAQAMAGHATAETVSRRLRALEHVALTRIAAGYSSGLGETIDRLVAAKGSCVDGATGAVTSSEFDERLSLEVERCQRMDLSLGLLELALDEPERGRTTGTPTRPGLVLREIGDCLRENLRGYDSVGLTQDGAFLLVLPDISRRGLAGAADRLRRRLDECTGHGQPSGITFAAAYYDLVDVNADEMITGLSRSMQEALRSKQPLAWA